MLMPVWCVPTQPMWPGQEAPVPQLTMWPQWARMDKYMTAIPTVPAVRYPTCTVARTLPSQWHHMLTHVLGIPAFLMSWCQVQSGTKCSNPKTYSIRSIKISNVFPILWVHFKEIWIRVNFYFFSTSYLLFLQVPARLRMYLFLHYAVLAQCPGPLTQEQTCT